MNLMTEVKNVLLRIFLPTILLCGATTAERLPNVVLIVADDMGYADVGVNGCTDIPTPHIDAIARRGVRCSNGYSSHPFCSPMRAALMTGRYQHRFGYETNCPYDPQNPRLGLPDDVVTVPSLLQKAGYKTGAIGKWHLGAHPKKHPLNRGFDYFYGFLGGGHDYFEANASVRDHEGYRQPLDRNGAPAGVDEYLTTAFAKDAAKFITTNKTAPFFLYLAFNAPHTPMQAPEEYLEKFSSIADPKRRKYAAMVNCMDDGIGRVIAALDEAGIREQTMIAFVSDNGGPTASNGSDNGPFRAGKGSVFEGGIRVPFLISWPGKLPEGTVYDFPVITHDLTVTALHLALAGKGQKLDGVHLIPHLKGDEPSPPHEALFWRMSHWKKRSRAVRDGHSGMKVVENVHVGEAPLMRVDVTADPGEATALDPVQGQTLLEKWNKWDAGNQPPAFHGFRAYHQRKNAFYKELDAEPAE
ncbi:MAG: arylsulfatase A-like enzyme [Verrucomicrobiales bacterium]|jgi:arylsulfatase A-like enzyme